MSESLCRSVLSQLPPLCPPELFVSLIFLCSKTTRNKPSLTSEQNCPQTWHLLCHLKQQGWLERVWEKAHVFRILPRQGSGCPWSSPLLCLFSALTLSPDTVLHFFKQKAQGGETSGTPNTKAFYKWSLLLSEEFIILENCYSWHTVPSSFCLKKHPMMLK